MSYMILKSIALIALASSALWSFSVIYYNYGDALSDALMAFFVLIYLSMLCYYMFAKARGTFISRASKMVAFASVYFTMLMMLAWIAIVVFKEYVGITYFNYLYTQEGIRRLFVFILFIMPCLFLFAVAMRTTNALVNVLRDLINNVSPVLKRRIGNFIFLYLFVLIYFTFLYSVTYYADNTAFQFTRIGTPMFLDFLYFSSTTMATLGTADLVPNRAFVKCCVMLQIYLNVFFLLLYISFAFGDGEGDRNEQAPKLQPNSGEG